MGEEMEIMNTRKVWHLEKPPPDITPIGCRWVYTIKRDEKGKIIRFKARLVAQGHTQVKGQSYEETFSPVINFNVIRFFFALLVSHKRWSHIQCDVTGAYLYAPIKEVIYKTQPPGFEKPDNKNKLCRLDRALYGLHQSGRQWYFEINKVLLQIGFQKFQWCNCAYVYNQSAILILYVDDFVIFGKTQSIIETIVKVLKKRFDIKMMGRTKTLLGVEFNEEKNGLVLHQTPYIDIVGERFEKFKIPTTSLPIAKGVIFSKSSCPATEAETKEMANLPYRSLLGCLMFIANRTRPDISYAVNILSQFQSNPGMAHWDALLKLLGYVKGTKNYQLKLTCNKPLLVVYSDADFAANRDDRTSLGGQLVLLGDSPIGWRTFKEKCVSLSTMEAEFIAMTEATKELMWYNNILGECYSNKILSNMPTKATLYVDNQATIDFVRSPIENHRSKHIDVKLFFVRDLVSQEKFNLNFIRSKLNLADPFTRPLTKNDLMNFINVIFKMVK